MRQLLFDVEADEETVRYPLPEKGVPGGEVGVEVGGEEPPEVGLGELLEPFGSHLMPWAGQLDLDPSGSVGTYFPD